MPHRNLQFVVATILACALTYWFIFNSDPPVPVLQEPIPASPVESIIPDPNDELPFYAFHAGGTVLGHHGIQNLTSTQIEVARFHINAIRDDTLQPPMMQHVNVKFPRFVPYNVKEPGTLPSPAKATIKVTAPSSIPIDASNIVFGVATTYERLEESLDQVSHWAGGTNCKIIALLQPSLDDKLPDRVMAKARRLSVPLSVVESSLNFLDRYFMLIRVMHDNRPPNARWLSFIDDDTFFVSLPNLLTTLAKYPPTQPWYVGSLSEDFRQMSHWGFMGYGGAGIFLSLPLVEQLLPHFASCFATRSTGDRMLAHCIYSHTSTKLTVEHGLHQMDLHGSHAGFYEALRPQPLSLHHWKSTAFDSHVDMYNLSRVSRICGDQCLLQKYRLAGGSWVLTNGFSLVRYSDADARMRDLDTDISMERTWYFIGTTTVDSHFEHSLAPLRQKDQGKVSFRLESALVEEPGPGEKGGLKVRQLYVARDMQERSVHAAVEVIWEAAN